MSIVVIADTTQGLKPALEEIFEPHGGIKSVIPKNGGTIYVKPNGIHFTPHSHTDPAVLEAVLAYLRDHGYTRLAVMESCTGGNFTRLVFKVTGYTDICRRYGAEAGLPGRGAYCGGGFVRRHSRPRLSPPPR